MVKAMVSLQSLCRSLPRPVTRPGCPGPLLCQRLPVLAPRKQCFGVEERGGGGVEVHNSMFPKSIYSGAGELAQQLGAPVLAEDPSSIPSTYMAPHNPP